jgi:hypothetical protein
VSGERGCACGSACFANARGFHLRGDICICDASRRDFLAKRPRDGRARRRLASRRHNASFERRRPLDELLYRRWRQKISIPRSIETTTMPRLFASVRDEMKIPSPADRPSCLFAASFSFLSFRPGYIVDKYGHSASIGYLPRVDKGQKASA